MKPGRLSVTSSNGTPHRFLAVLSRLSGPFFPSLCFGALAWVTMKRSLSLIMNSTYSPFLSPFLPLMCTSSACHRSPTRTGRLTGYTTSRSEYLLIHLQMTTWLKFRFMPLEVPLYLARRHAPVEVQVDDLGDRLAAGPLSLEAQVVGKAPAATEASVPLDVIVFVVTQATFQRIGGAALGTSAGAHQLDTDGLGRLPGGVVIETLPDLPYVLTLSSSELEAKVVADPAAVGARHRVLFARLREHDIVVGASAVDQYSLLSLVGHSHTVMAYRRLITMERFRFRMAAHPWLVAKDVGS